MVWGGRREEGSGWGTPVYLWRIHFNIWRNQYNIVNFKNKIKFKKKTQNKQTNNNNNKIDGEEIISNSFYKVSIVQIPKPNKSAVIRERYR